VEIVVRHALVVTGFFLAVIIVVRLLREHRAPGNTMAWLLAIILIPYVGVPLYLLFGGRKIGRVARHREPLPLEIPDDTAFVTDTEHVLCATGIPRSRAGNQIVLVTDGVAAYEDLVELIESAEHSLHIATFILGKDEIGRDIVERLTRRAQQGIQVRLLLDALGCFWTHRKFVASLRKAGGQVGVFLPMIPYRRKWSANLRNHRKIWIADEKTAIVGGRNISESYMGPRRRESQWADFGVRIEGPAVRDLFEVFCSDWEFVTQETLHPRRKFEAYASGGSSRLQVVASGPDTRTNSLYQGVLASIVAARERIWIATPYFIPDDTFVSALSLAAQMGRDVRILLPLQSNHRLADFARGSYLRQLNQVGVKCRGYTPGMLHTKLLLIDNELAVLGSANMDMRSLYLNFEVGVFVYSPEPVTAIARHLETLMKTTTPLVWEERTRSDHARLWFEDISRLFAPLL
jgi:cardiolipin synthase